MHEILNCLRWFVGGVERNRALQPMRSDCSGAAVSKGQMMEQRSKQSSVGHMTYTGLQQRTATAVLLSRLMKRPDRPSVGEERRGEERGPVFCSDFPFISQLWFL